LNVAQINLQAARRHRRHFPGPFAQESILLGFSVAPRNTLCLIERTMAGLVRCSDPAGPVDFIAGKELRPRFSPGKPPSIFAPVYQPAAIHSFLTGLIPHIYPSLFFVRQFSQPRIERIGRENPKPQ
jgi:hypothetical protein